MPSFVPTSPETLEDQRLYTEARLEHVLCGTCSARVQVKKNSEHHTAIQWNAAALAACVSFQEAAASAVGRAVHAACPRLQDSIDAAVAAGAIAIGAEDGY